MELLDIKLNIEQARKSIQLSPLTEAKRKNERVTKSLSPGKFKTEFEKKHIPGSFGNNLQLSPFSEIKNDQNMIDRKSVV